MTIPEVYGASFYALAKEEKIETELFSNLKYVVSIFEENPKYVKILDSPVIAKDELMKILDEDFSEQINKYTLNLIKILCEKHILHHISGCVKEYERLYNKDNNIKIVKVTTAKPLDEANENRLVKKLTEKFGCKIVIKKYVNSECLGGIILQSDDMKIDSSIRSKLLEIKKALI